MCTHLIKIYNKSHYHNPKAIRLYMTVPCGKCPECIQQKRSEWSLRSQIEYDYCKNNGGYVYFDTLTYRDSSLPRFRNHPCFQREHIQYFLKRLRKRIADELKITQRAFRYFYVSEYGHKYKRPHYHILFFVSSAVPVRFLKRIITEEWKYGFTDLQSVKRPEVGIVRSELCCNYVAKYVTKPDFYISSLYDELKDFVSKEDFRKFFNPFHQQSTGFGESILFDYRNLENFKEMFCVFRRKKYNLPMYYIRRLYYKLEENPDGSKSWRPNDLGCQFVSQYKYMLYETYSENLRSFVGSWPQLLRTPSVHKRVSDFLSKDSRFDSSLSSGDIVPVDSIVDFISVYDSAFIADFSFWKRFQQGYVIYDKSFNPLVDTTDDLNLLIEFNVFDNDDRSSLLAALDSRSVPENLFFDSLLTQFKLAVGELDCNKFNLTDKTKRLFTYFNYAN